MLKFLVIVIAGVVFAAYAFTMFEQTFGG